MPCGLGQRDKDTIEDTKKHFSERLGQIFTVTEPSPFTTKLADQINSRWETLVTELSNEEHNEGWRVYSVGHKVMMAIYHSLHEDLGSKTGLDADSWGISFLLEKTWVPAVLTICGVTEAERRRFQEEYWASVT